MNDASSGKKRIEHASLLSFATALLRAGGFTDEQAAQTADVLLWANLRAVDSHGVLRIPRYIEMVELGLINPAARLRELSSKGAISIVDADRAPGAFAMNFAMQAAVDRAEAHGMGWCAMRGITHAGAIGYYAERAAKLGRVAIVMTASKPLMIYHGSKADGVSTNPISIAAPTSDPERPLLLDMSTASVPIGKIMAARDAGKPIPLGWGVDKDGFETTDPAKVKSVLPMAGAKGSGLSLMIEVLASVMTGNPLIARALTQGGDPGGNGVVIALDPAAFGPSGDLVAGTSELSGAIKALPPASGVDSILLPGERGYLEARRRMQAGIPLAAGTLTNLVKLASRLRVSPPADIA
jgi:ureidoglycolate dehydrogenase (NAD+)